MDVKKGDWVCRMNYHLVTNWMKGLEKIVEEWECCDNHREGRDEVYSKKLLAFQSGATARGR